MAKDTSKFDLKTIMCSGGKGEMTNAECLQCALDGQNWCGYDYALLRAIMEDNLRTGIHVSDLINCVRMAYYNRTETVPEYIHERLAVTLGTAVHHHMELEDDPEVLSEIPVTALGVVGTVDLFYPKQKKVIDIKTTRWLKLENLPYGHNIQQVNIYAYMLKQMGYEVEELAIQYIDMSGPKKCSKCKIPLRMTEGGHIECPKCGKAPRGAHLGAVVYPIPLYDEDET